MNISAPRSDRQNDRTDRRTYRQTDGLTNESVAAVAPRRRHRIEIPANIWFLLEVFDFAFETSQNQFVLKGELANFHQVSRRFVLMRGTQLTRSWTFGSFLTPSNDKKR